MLDLLIRGGQVVTPQGVGRWDIAVQAEQVAAVGMLGDLPEAGRVIDATGKIVVPGGVEPHTHLAHHISMQADENLFGDGSDGQVVPRRIASAILHRPVC